MSVVSSVFLCSLFVFFSRERDSLSFFLTFDLSILPSCLFFFFFLQSKKRSPPALARRHQPLPSNRDGVEPHVMLLHRDAPLGGSSLRHHLLRECEADEERARARVLDFGRGPGGREDRGLLLPLRGCCCCPRRRRLAARSPSAVGPGVVVAQASPEPPAFPVKGDPGQEEGVDAR